MLERREWDDVIKRRGRLEPSLSLVMPLQRAAQGAARAFLGRASDDRRYWIKVPGPDVGTRMLTAEQVVGRLGTLLGSATCTVETVLVPAGLNYEYRPGRVLPECVAHASLRVDGVAETRSLNRPNDDDNAVRYTSFAALYDLAWGDDVQGLEVLSDDGRFYSHDHGWYLPPGRGNWTGKIVEDFVDVPHALGGVRLDPGEASRVAKRLEAITRDQLASVLAGVPAAWGITDHELESIGYFLERRAPQVASRLLSAAGDRR
jgi:hypothetical protein